MSGDNVVQRFTPESTQAFEQAVQAAEEQDKLDQIESLAADRRVRQLLREGAL